MGKSDKQYWDFHYSEGRYVSIDSTILASEREIDNYVGKTVYWHELAGKHSEGEFVLSRDMFTPAEIAEVGFNPLEAIAEYEEDLQEDGTLPPPKPSEGTQRDIDLEEMRERYPLTHMSLCNDLPDMAAKNEACVRLYDDAAALLLKHTGTRLQDYIRPSIFTMGITVYSKMHERADKEDKFAAIVNGIEVDDLSVKERYTLLAMKDYTLYSSLYNKLLYRGQV